jgi:hypothetical protein
MAETKLVVQHREHLWSLLVEAAQFEHMIMCSTCTPVSASRPNPMRA